MTHLASVEWDPTNRGARSHCQESAHSQDQGDDLRDREQEDGDDLRQLSDQHHHPLEEERTGGACLQCLWALLQTT